MLNYAMSQITCSKLDVRFDANAMSWLLLAAVKAKSGKEYSLSLPFLTFVQSRAAPTVIPLLPTLENTPYPI